jgi:hypothetical protein
MNIVEMEIREMDGKFEQKNKGGGGSPGSEETRQSK